MNDRTLDRFALISTTPIRWFWSTAVHTTQSQYTVFMQLTHVMTMHLSRDIVFRANS